MSEPQTSEAEAAFAEAVDTGEPVEIASMRDEYTQTYANPDGLTQTLESHAAAVFGRDEDGELVDIDTTLTVAADGTVRPVAAAVDIEFPSGDSDVLSVKHRGKGFDLALEGDLGEPVLEGDTATYVDVFPDVDLKLTALPEGMRQVYVVKTPEAAADPRLNRLTFPVESENGSVQARADGGLMFVDTMGDVTFSSPPPLMWDSSGDPAVLDAVSGPGGEPVEEFAAPSSGDEQSEMPVDVTDAAVAITPSSDMLDDPETEYPVYIDPNTGYEATQRLMLRSDDHSAREWQFTGTEGMGRCPTSYDSKCTGPYRKRIFYSFPNENLNGADRVIRSELSVRSTHSTSCLQREVIAYRTEGISSTTPWPGPASLGQLGSQTFSYGNDCRGPGYLEISTNALLGATRDLVGGAVSRLTIGLRAADENDQHGWKRFSSDAMLKITYYRKPGVPTNVLVQTNKGAGCLTSSSNQQVIDSRTPSFKATVQALQQPGEGDDTGRFRAHFELQRFTGNWVAASEFREPKPGDSPVGYADDRSLTYLTPPAGALIDGGRYRVRAQTEALFNDPLEMDPGPWSDWCYFQVDLDRPHAPIVKERREIQGLAPIYPREVDGNVLWGGRPGTSADFLYAPDPEDPDANVVRYQHLLVADGGAVVPLAGEHGGRVTPTRPGPHALYVSAVDKGDRESAPQIYRFNVKDHRRPTVYWQVAESSGTTIANAQDVVDETEEEPGMEDPASRSLTLSDSAIISGDGFGRRGVKDQGGTTLFDHSLSFTAPGQRAVSDTHVIDTSKSFTVSAWVNLADASEDRIVLGQGSANTPAGFDIRYLRSANAWSVGWTANTSPASTTVRATASTPAVPNAWTQVSAVYDASDGSLSLLLNGRLAAWRTGLTGALKPVSTNSKLVIGAATPTSNANGFRGYVDEILVWNDTAVPADVLARAGAYDQDSTNLALAASWNSSSEGTATSIPDSSPFRSVRSAMALEGATRDSTTGQVILNGGGGLKATGPVLDETGAFTVTTNFSLDSQQMALAGRSKARIMGQQAANGNPSWALWFVRTGVDAGARAYGEWRFGRWSSAANAEAVASTAPHRMDKVLMDTDVAVSAVYNPLAPGQELCVFAGSLELGCTAYATPLQGAGELTAGMSPSTAGRTDFMVGRLNCMKAWVGAATSNHLGAHSSCN